MKTSKSEVSRIRRNGRAGKGKTVSADVPKQHVAHNTDILDDFDARLSRFEKSMSTISKFIEAQTHAPANFQTTQDALQETHAPLPSQTTAAKAAALMEPPEPRKSEPVAAPAAPVKPAWQPASHYSRQIVALLLSQHSDPEISPHFTMENGVFIAVFHDGARVKVLFKGPMQRIKKTTTLRPRDK